MFPVLFAWGPLQLRTITLFIIMSILATAFLFWRKGREEHYQEEDVFDVFLWSSFWGFIWARIGYIILQFPHFGLSPLKWIDVFGEPGVSLTVGLVAASVFMYRSAHGRKWDAFEILDFWSIALTNGLAWLALGWWFDGVAFGTATNLPWGMVFPGVFERHHPNQLYLVLLYVLLFIYLSKVEYRYRMFSWYRGGKNTAQTGFLVSLFLIIVSVFYLGLSFITPSTWTLSFLRLDQVVAVAGLISGAVLLYQRSGRTIWRPRFHR